MSKLFLTSFSALKEYLLWRPDLILDLQVHQKAEGQLQDLLRETDTTGLPVQVVKTGANLAARVRVERFDLNALMDSDASLAVGLYGITDCGNFGQIIRTCAFFNVEHLLLQTHHQAAVTQATMEATCGGLARVKLIYVDSLPTALRRLAEMGFERVGFDAAAAVDLADFLTSKDRHILLFGSEDQGFDQRLKKCIDQNLVIGPRGLDSLNVGVSVGIGLYGLRNL